MSSGWYDILSAYILTLGTTINFFNSSHTIQLITDRILHNLLKFGLRAEGSPREINWYIGRKSR